MCLGGSVWHVPLSAWATQPRTSSTWWISAKACVGRTRMSHTSRDIFCTTEHWLLTASSLEANNSVAIRQSLRKSTEVIKASMFSLPVSYGKHELGKLSRTVYTKIKGLSSPDAYLKASSVPREKQPLAMAALKKDSILRLEGSIAQSS